MGEHDLLDDVSTAGDGPESSGPPRHNASITWATSRLERARLFGLAAREALCAPRDGLAHRPACPAFFQDVHEHRSPCDLELRLAPTPSSRRQVGELSVKGAVKGTQVETPVVLHKGGLIGCIKVSLGGLPIRRSAAQVLSSRADRGTSDPYGRAATGYWLAPRPRTGQLALRSRPVDRPSRGVANAGSGGPIVRPRQLPTTPILKYGVLRLAIEPPSGGLGAPFRQRRSAAIMCSAARATVGTNAGRRRPGDRSGTGAARSRRCTGLWRRLARGRFSAEVLRGERQRQRRDLTPRQKFISKLMTKTLPLPPTG